MLNNINSILSLSHIDREGKKYSTNDILLKYINEDKGTEIVESTGPFMMSRVYDAYKDKENVTLVPGDLVAPLTDSEVRLVIKGQETKEIENKVEKVFISFGRA